MFKNLVLGALLPLALVIAGLAVFFGLKSPPPPQTQLPQPVVEELLPHVPRAEVEAVHALAEMSDTLDIQVTGTVVPYREIQIAAEAAGRIVHKDPEVRDGKYVKKGQLLYRIDPRDYELEVERLTRMRDQELASIRELQQDIENTRNLMEVAEEELKLAEADVRRFEQLDSNFSSAAELDQARRSRLSSMNQRVNLQNQIRTFQTRQSRLELAAKLAETQLAQAKLNLERTTVVAPVSGRVVSEQVETDSYVQRGTPMMVIEDTEKVEVACNIRMDQLYWILDQPDLSTDQLVNAAQTGRYELPPTPVNVQFELSGREATTYVWQGELHRYDGAGIDPQSRTVPIRIRVDHPSDVTTVDGRAIDASGPPMLVRGMFVDAVVKARPTTQLLLVPKLSIKPSTNSNVIWKFTPNEQAVFATTTAIASLEAAQDETRAPAAETEEPVINDVETADPTEWEAGFLTIVDDVRMVTSFGQSGDVEYWVCEVGLDQLGPGDLVVTTPLPGVKADGTDPIRVEKASLPSSTAKLASTTDQGDQG